MFPARSFTPRSFPRRTPTVPGSSQKERIHNALVDLASTGVFHTVTYSPTTGLQTRGDVAAPRTILTNEVSGAFLAQARRYRRGARQDRGTWRWRLIAAFDREVTLESFEEDLMNTPRWLPATSELRRVDLILVSSTYDHPQKHGAASGTTATFVFDASQAPL